MRIALDRLVTEHTDNGAHPGLILTDEFGCSVELYVHTDPREAYLLLSGLVAAICSLQFRLDPFRPYEDLPRIPR